MNKVNKKNIGKKIMVQNVDIETDIRFNTFTNQRQTDRLITNTFRNPFMGAGQNTKYNKDLESFLLYGLSTTDGKACKHNQISSINRYQQSIPEFINPQKVNHIIEPWIRGGEPTRDYIRKL